MLKKTKLTFLFLILLISSSFAQKADDIIGKYRLPNDIEIEMFKVGDKYFGKIIALNSYHQTKDVKNPDKSKRNEPLLGQTVVKELEFDEKEKKWLNGTIYGVEKGIFLNFKVTKMQEKEITVVASKYVFWKTLIWKRI